MNINHVKCKSSWRESEIVYENKHLRPVIDYVHTSDGAVNSAEVEAELSKELTCVWKRCL